MPAILTESQRLKKKRAIARQLGLCLKCFKREAMPVRAGTDWPRKDLCGVCDEAQEDSRPNLPGSMIPGRVGHARVQQ